MKLRELARSAWSIALLGSLGCAHEEPFGAQRYDTDHPFSPGPPVRLTLNRGPDRGAAWLPDRSGILYSTQVPETFDHDVCLAVLPPGGGRQQSLTCELVPTGEQLTEAIESGAPSLDGRLAFFTASSNIGATLPLTQAPGLAPLSNPIQHQLLLSLPASG